MIKFLFQLVLGLVAFIVLGNLVALLMMVFMHPIVFGVLVTFILILVTKLFLRGAN